MKNERARKWAAQVLKYLPLALYAGLIVFVFVKRDEWTLDMLLSYTPAQPVLAFFFLMLVFAFKSVSVFIAIHLLYALGAVLFPMPLALAVNFVGTVVVSTVPYFLGRRGGEQAQQRLDLDKHPAARRIAATMDDHPVCFVMMLRLLGVFPCDLVSMYFGARGTDYGAYLLGSLLGFLPTLLSYTLMAAYANDPSSPVFWIAVALIVGGVATSGVMALRMYLQNRRSKKDE